MSYQRVIPRDLFNEANLLKCYGQIYLNLERMNVNAELVNDESTDEGFRIVQDGDSGSLTIENVYLMVGGKQCELRRPLNSRSPYPLYLTTEDEEEISVFNDDGSFTDDMRSLLQDQKASK